MDESAHEPAAGDDERVDRDETLRAILEQVRQIAVVGIKDGESEDAFRVPRYLQAHGYRIVPVNPKLERVLGERAYPDLLAVQAAGLRIDLVDLFRAADKIAGHVDEILALAPRPQCVWMQLGIEHGPSAARLRAEGIAVVQDRCIMVDHRRLIGDRASEPARDPRG